MQSVKGVKAKRRKIHKGGNMEPCHRSNGGALKQSKTNPDHAAENARLNRIKGQLNGVERMISEQRYCPDILIQIKAVGAALKSLEGAILERHLKSCVKSAFESKNKKSTDAKVEELIKLFLKTD